MWASVARAGAGAGAAGRSMALVGRARGARAGPGRGRGARPAAGRGPGGAPADPQGRGRRCRASKGFGAAEEATAAEAEAEGTAAGAAAEAAGAEGELMAVEKLGRKRGRRRVKQKVVSPVVESISGDAPLSMSQQVETAFVSVLLFLGVLILAEGVFIGGAGFLSEGLDDFALKVVYPAFTPTVGVFLAGSTVYGFLKTRDGLTDAP